MAINSRVSPFEDNFTGAEPYAGLIEDEIHEQILNFCSLCAIMSNKKVTLQTILLSVLKDKDYMELYRDIMGDLPEQECILALLRIDPNAFSSKTIAKHLRIR